MKIQLHTLIIICLVLVEVFTLLFGIFCIAEDCNIWVLEFFLAHFHAHLHHTATVIVVLCANCWHYCHVHIHYMATIIVVPCSSYGDHFPVSNSLADLSVTVMIITQPFYCWLIYILSRLQNIISWIKFTAIMQSYMWISMLGGLYIHFSFSFIILTAIIQSYVWISMFCGLCFSLIFQLYNIYCNNTILYVDICVWWFIFFTSLSVV